jgi:ABC-type branched-subunit amino acid transport system substrate-binding protein
MNPRRPLAARTNTVAFAAVVLGSSILLAGCGASSTRSADGAGSCPTQTPGVTTDSVKIGLIYPDTGPTAVASTFKGTRSAVQARIDQQNASGGVGGRRIDVVWGDDESDSGKFTAEAHDLVDTENVFGLVAQSIVVDGSAPWLQAQGIPVTGTATSASWSIHPNLFHFGNVFNPGSASTIGDYVKAQGGTKALVVIDSSTATSQNLAAQFTPSLRSRGIQVVGEVPFTDGLTSPSHVAHELADAGANTLVAATRASTFIDIYTQAKALGITLAAALSATGYDPGLLTQRGDDMAGISIISGYSAVDSPAMLAYDRAMSTYAPELADPRDDLALAGYVAADEMIEGLRLAGTCPTREAFIQNLRKVTNFTGGGLVAPVDLSKPLEPDNCFNFVKVDHAGRAFTLVPPPAALDKNGFWCGAPLT